MLCNCICILTGLYDKIYIRIIKKQNTCKVHVTHDLSIAVKVTIILFLCGLLNCIRADLFINNALYKCCIITHCAVSHKDHIKKWYHRFIFHFFDLVEGRGVQLVCGVLRGGASGWAKGGVFGKLEVGVGTK